MHVGDERARTLTDAGSAALSFDCTFKTRNREARNPAKPRAFEHVQTGVQTYMHVCGLQNSTGVAEKVVNAGCDVEQHLSIPYTSQQVLVLLSGNGAAAILTIFHLGTGDGSTDVGPTWGYWDPGY